MALWRKNPIHGQAEQYFADRSDGTEMTVTAHPDGTHTIYVYDPSSDTEYLMGELEDTTVNACIQRAEEVVLPDEDTGA